MNDKHKNLIKLAHQSIEEARKSVEDNHWSMNFHMAPPSYWMNDPNGFCYFNGEYHLFYQHHPFSPEWGPMYWGHAKSKDLSSWEHLPIALAPSENYDKDGCFSGSAIEKDGKLYLMYTGNVWTGNNHDTDLLQVQCLAVSQDGIHFEKISENPVIEQAPEGDIHPFHFRDPKVWKHEEVYYCVLGSRTKDHVGQVLLYRSLDLIKWDFINVAAKGEGNFGYMWECPDIFPLDDYDVLMMSPQGMKEEEYLYHNLHQSGYVLGKLDYEKGILEHGEFQLLDYGFDVYAPQTAIDEEGRRIMIAWMAMWESEMPEQSHKWAGAMTIPRVLTIEEGQIVSRPVPELKTLRQQGDSIGNKLILGEHRLQGFEGDSYELELVIDAKGANEFGIKLRVDEDQTEETVFTYNRSEGMFTFDRNKSGKGPKGVRRAPVNLVENKLHLHFFVDRSSIEVFINDGAKTMTGRIYPEKKSLGIMLFSDQEVEVTHLNKWNLNKSIKPYVCNEE
ncbi:sucrose-6-phosphate hydrolase [Bacillus sp. 31A1R]|uniref:Sucrose-6-phosphate hydrolase n=1 Tax=Robertmurraya mangrovi TaxID=3098077 RepID=A0ABU5J3L9_9BACI|nr:sucrose-6-phosphate hydrolase [Bacillus sp. 31A1R]MDZ5473993.1 sucrose-6-phosphate hydrolase [Bacillus sp. 31A1R]